MKKWSVFGGLIILALFTRAQRSYSSSSALSSGQWLKLSIAAPGIYKVTGAQLKNAGLLNPVSSDKIRLFGTGGAELPESNAGKVFDDLPEISIEMSDGGDGFFDGNDFLLFHASGPHQWIFEDGTRQYQFKKNHYSNKSYYFLQVSDVKGRRIGNAPLFSNPSRKVSSFYEHYRHELDSFNFLRSGKEWFGEDFSNQPGRKASREFILPFSVAAGSSLRVVSDLAGRGFGQVNRIPVSVNGSPLLEHQTSPLIGNILEPAANPSRQEGVTNPTLTNVKLTYQFNGSGVNAEAWLNWFEVHCSRNLDMQGLAHLHFRDTLLQPTGIAIEYSVANPTPNTVVWDITNPLQPLRISTQTGNPLRFVQEATAIKEYIAFDATQVSSPSLEGFVSNQNLHATGAQDMVIVADKSLIGEANRLALFHRQKHGFSVLVTEPEKIFNEFSSGIPDPTAIRDFMKMLYDRAGNDPSLKPKYLLLFGIASYIQNESRLGYKNRIPSFQSKSSLDPLTSYVTDDYFGFLDDGEDININLPAPLLDIGIGRIPARSVQEASVVVNKILNYHRSSSYGDWRSNMTFVADDEDFNLHLNDAEQHTSLVNTVSSFWNIKKIYLDAFSQEAGTAGSFYPEVNAAISRDMNRGTLVWNYSGHGGSSRLAQESILDKSMLARWENNNRLPLFITATCDFAPFDDQSQYSIGEELLMARPSGAVALMTTTRLVFASSNKIINNNFLNALLSKDSKGKVPFLGDALKQSKNFTVQNTGDYINARKFVMLGDPAMKPGIPEFGIRTLSINGRPFGNNTDTLRMLEEQVINGEVISPDGSVASDFNGEVYARVFDKPLSINTLANDPQSREVSFLSSESILYSGKVKAENGKFSFRFITPKDMDPRSGKGRISYYAFNENYDAAGGTDKIIVGGFGNTALVDQNGPLLAGYLDTSTFRNGDLVSPSPVLYLELSDLSGINQTGSLGHEIIAVIDGDQSNAIILNDLFAPASSNRSGTIQYRLSQLSDGEHTISIRAWDVFNNSSVLTLQFKIATPKAVAITKLRCVPNPVRGNAAFRADLDGPTDGAQLQITLFTIGGQQVRSFVKTINEPALRSILLEWDGKDERGNMLGSGIYVFVMKIKTQDGIWTQKTERLIVH
ncbi:MAG: type IX secretion system sortase PorU [Chitinophagia bacterium]